MKRNAVLFAATLLSIVFLNLLYFTACTEELPERFGCSTVRFQGLLYEVHCPVDGGLTTVTITQNGKTLCFDLTCSSATNPVTRNRFGCLERVTLCNGSVSPMNPSGF